MHRRQQPPPKKRKKHARHEFTMSYENDDFAGKIGYKIKKKLKLFLAYL